jgi:hypothetical protein
MSKYAFSIVAILFLSLIAQPLQAQYNKSAKNTRDTEGETAIIIGMAPLSLIPTLGRVHFRGEYAYRHNKSVSVLLGVPRKTDVPTFITELSTLDSVGGSVAQNNYKSFALNIGHRFYFGGKKPAGGFFLEPYVRYSRFTVKHEQGNDDAPGNTVVTAKIGGPGIGGALGVQWRIGQHFSFDLTTGADLRFMGGSVAYKSTDPNNDIVAFRDKVQEKVKDWPLLGDGIAAQLNGDEVKVRVPSSPIPLPRLNITIGYAF